MRVLRALLRLVDVGLRGDELRPVALLDLGPRLGDRVVADAGRVGTHVRDEADGAAVALEIDAFVQRLGDLHRPLGAEVEVARRVLLELGRRVRRRRVALLLLAHDLGDPVGAALEVGPHAARLLAVGDLEAFVVGRGELGQDRRVGLGSQTRGDVPVLFGDEGVDLALAVDEEAERHRLHAAGGEAEGELGPDQRRDVVAHDAVEHAASALGVVEVLVELARVLDAVVDALLRDLVELDALDLEARALDLLLDVERDRLALAIGVGRQHHGVDLLGRGLELFEDLLFALDDRVRLREIVREVDGLRALGQVLQVSLRGEDVVARAEVFLDGLRLGRRLNDNERLGHHDLLGPRAGAFGSTSLGSNNRLPEPATSRKWARKGWVLPNPWPAAGRAAAPTRSPGPPTAPACPPT